MEPEGSLQCSQESNIGPYPEPDIISPHPHTLLNTNLNILFYLYLKRDQFLLVSE